MLVCVSSNLIATGSLSPIVLTGIYPCKETKLIYHLMDSSGIESKFKLSAAQRIDLDKRQSEKESRHLVGVLILPKTTKYLDYGHLQKRILSRFK